LRARKSFDKVLGFLGFRLKHDSGGFAGWEQRKTLFWIAAADSQGKWRRYRKRRHRLSSLCVRAGNRKAVDDLGAFLAENDMKVADPPGSYNGDDQYYAGVLQRLRRHAARSHGVRPGEETGREEGEDGS